MPATTSKVEEEGTPERPEGETSLCRFCKWSVCVQVRWQIQEGATPFGDPDEGAKWKEKTFKWKHSWTCYCKNPDFQECHAGVGVQEHGSHYPRFSDVVQCEGFLPRHTKEGE